MALAEDLDVMFDTAGFAVSASRTPLAGGSVQTGVLIFDNPGLVLEDLGVVTSEPTALIPSSQWAGIAVGDTVTINSSGYKVRSTVPESDGAVTRLVLARSS